MTDVTRHPLVRQYLHSLTRAARDLPRSRRRELNSDLTEHLAAALSEHPSEAEIRAVLDRLGPPEEIVAAEETGASSAVAPHETWAIVLLVIGGLFLGIGWLVGLALLWTSRVWTLRDKLIGTFVLPGGLAGSFFLLGAGFTTGTSVCGPQRIPRPLQTGGIVPSNPAHAAGAVCAGTPGPNVLAILLFVLLVLAPLAMAAYLTIRARRLNRAEGAAPPSVAPSPSLA
jgi:hypothetical protein